MVHSPGSISCRFFHQNLFCFYLCDCMPCVCVGACRGQKGALDLLELELQVDVSHWPWVLGTELRFSGTAASIFNIAPSLQPSHSFLLTRSMTQAGLELDALRLTLNFWSSCLPLPPLPQTGIATVPSFIMSYLPITHFFTQHLTVNVCSPSLSHVHPSHSSGFIILSIFPHAP